MQVVIIHLCWSIIRSCILYPHDTNIPSASDALTLTLGTFHVQSLLNTFLTILQLQECLMRKTDAPASQKQSVPSATALSFILTKQAL